MRLRDRPIIEVTRTLRCSPEQAWDLVTDITLPTRVAGELQRVEWVGGATEVALGARFRGLNKSDDIGEWRTDCEVVEVDEGRRWVWRVGPAEAPMAMWGFEVDPSREGCLVRQWGRLGAREVCPRPVRREPARPRGEDHRLSARGLAPRHGGESGLR